MEEMALEGLEGWVVAFGCEEIEGTDISARERKQSRSSDV